jgi:hypothetical protein
VQIGANYRKSAQITAKVGIGLFSPLLSAGPKPTLLQQRRGTMKLNLLTACAALAVAGCATQSYRGGVDSPYQTEYGYGGVRTLHGPYLESYDSIYPVRRQSSPTGTDGGIAKPALDPVREYDYWDDQVYIRDYPPRAPVPPPPPEIIP